MATINTPPAPAIETFQIHAQSGENPINFSNYSPLNQSYLKHIRQAFLQRPAPVNNPPVPAAAPIISHPQPLYAHWIITEINDPDGLLTNLAAQLNLNIPSHFVRPYGVCLDNSNNIYISDWSTRLVYKLAASDQKLLWVTNLPPNGIPYGLTYSRTNNKLYVVDAQQWKIWLLEADSGQTSASFGHQGVEAGQFVHPTAISCDANGYVYITDRYINRLHRFDADGGNPLYYQLLSQESADYNISGVLALGGGDSLKLYITDSFNDHILYFSTNPFIQQIAPQPPQIWGKHGDRDGEFHAPIAIACHSDLFILEQANRRIQRFSADHTYIAKGEKLSGKFSQGHEYFFNGAEGLAVDSSGELYVADTVNRRLLKIAAPIATTDAVDTATEKNFTFAKQLIDLRPGSWLKALQQHERIYKLAQDRYRVARAKFQAATGLNDAQHNVDLYSEMRADVLQKAADYIENKTHEQYTPSTEKLLNIAESEIAQADTVSKIKQLMSGYLNYSKPLDWHATTEQLISDILGSDTITDSRNSLYMATKLFLQKKIQLADKKPVAISSDLQHSEEALLDATLRYVSAEKANYENLQRNIEWYRQFSNSWEGTSADHPDNQLDEWWRGLLRYARGTADIHKAWDTLQTAYSGYQEQGELSAALEQLDIMSGKFSATKSNLLNAQRELIDSEENFLKFKNFLMLQGISGTDAQLRTQLNYRYQQELQAYEKIQDYLKKQAKNIDIRYYLYINNEYIDQYGNTLLEHIQQFKAAADHQQQNILHIPYPDDGTIDNDFYKRYLIIYNPLFSGLQIHPPSVFFQEKFSLSTQWSGISLGELSHSISLFPGEQRDITLTITKKKSTSLDTSSTMTEKQTSSREQNLAAKQTDHFQSKLSNAIETNRTSASSLTQTSKYHSNNEVGFGFGLDSLFSFGFSGKSGVSGNVENSQISSLNSVRKRISSTARQLSSEVSSNNKLSFQTSSASSETKTYSFKSEDLETSKTDINLSNNNNGKTINYHFFQLINNYSSTLFAENLTIVFDSGIELIPGSGLTLSKSYNIDDYAKLIRDFKFIDQTAELARTVVLLISADLIQRYLATHYRDHSQASPKLIKTSPRQTKKWQTLKADLDNALLNQSIDTILDINSPLAKELLDFISSRKIVSSTQVSEKEYYSMNSGKWFLDAHLGYHVATEEYLENRRTIETDRQQALVEEIIARSAAGTFPTQLPENLQALSLNGSGIGTNISVNLTDTSSKK